MNLTTHTPGFADIESVANNLDDLDVLEWYYAAGPDIMGAIQHAVIESKDTARVAYAGGVPVGLYGVVSYEPTVGAPWAIFTPAARDIPLKSMRLAHALIDEWSSTYETLFVQVWGGNYRALHFLEALGFISADLCERHGQLFQIMTMTVNPHV